ncbi:amine oxidase [flavin-containing] B-like [Ylistrum balloti]|uniref:amine oxidase [flavin-containing] B-like n=1 Tax=Ylistrum balloti TaxID=509963 RepID=UPI002905B45A|nr:amine oxidase [flavin-containing] B-like [Ylistrum balloti]
MAGSEVDVVVIGAGLSGLYAAKILEENGLTVSVVEARDRVGGRTCTIKGDNNGYTDVGAAYVGPTQDIVKNLAKELGLELTNVYEVGKTIMNYKSIWATFGGVVPPYWNPFKLLDLNNIIRTIDRMAKQVPRNAPWMAQKAAEWDSMTVKEFIDRNCWTNAASDILLFVRSTLTSEPHEVSFLFFLWFVHSGGGVMRLASVKDGAQEQKIIGGTQQLSEGMTKKLKGTVHLSCPVVSVDQTKEKVLVKDVHGHEYQGKYVVSSVPHALLNRITFYPPLPDLKLQLIQRMPMGSIIKTFMFYDKPFWREQNYNGMITSDFGPVAFCLDDTKPDGSHPCIMGFVLADKSRDLVEMSESERKNILCQYYAKAFKMDVFLQPIDYIEKNWMAEEFSGGCYLGVMPPGVLTKYGRMLRKPLGHVHFAGTETATEWMGYMDGALQSGERAAREILDKLAIQWSETGISSTMKTITAPSLSKRFLPSINAILYVSTGVAFGYLAYLIYPMFFGWRWKVTSYAFDKMFS